MKAQRNSLTVVVLLLLTLGLPNALGATKPKAAGRSAIAVINTLLNGAGAPSKSIGIDGDFYIDTRSLLISGPKTKGKWPAARSMQGANGVNGSNGSDGRNGSDAKSVTTASTVAGPAGPQGQAGAKGADGTNGAPGAVGATGPSGSGSAGAPGAPGSNGSNGSNGSPGGTGLTGARGETGTVGPSEVTIGTLTFSNISGAVGSSSTSTLSSLKAGKSYLVRLMIHTYHPADRFNDSGMLLNLTTAASSGAPVITKHFIQVSGNTYRNAAEGLEWSIDAELIIDGALVENDYGVSITVTAGKSTTSNPLKIDCKFTALLVGAVK